MNRVENSLNVLNRFELCTNKPIEKDFSLYELITKVVLFVLIMLVTAGIAYFVSESVQNLWTEIWTGKTIIQSTQEDKISETAKSSLKTESKKKLSPLEKENARWLKMIGEQKIENVHLQDDDYWTHFYTSRHEVIGPFLLGNISSYQSLDPEYHKVRFTQIRHKSTANHVFQKVKENDPDCCSKDDVRAVVSVTDFPYGQGVTQFDTFVPELPETIKRYHLPVGDGSWKNLQPYLPKIFQFLDQARETNKDGHILVHCTGGKSRSPIVLTAYLHYCFKGAMDVDQIYSFVKTKRPIIGAIGDLMDGLRDWVKSEEYKKLLAGVYSK